MPRHNGPDSGLFARHATNQWLADADLQSSEFTVGILGSRIEPFVALDSDDLIQTTLTTESLPKTDTKRSVSPSAFE